MSIFQMTAAKKVTTDDLQELVAKDLDKIIKFIQANTPSGYIPERKKKDAKNAFSNKAQKLQNNWAILRRFNEQRNLGLPLVAKLEKELNGDAKVLEPSKYDFGYLLWVDGPVSWDYDTNKSVFTDSSEDSGLKPYLKALDANKSGTVPVLKGKVIDLNMVLDASEGLRSHLFFYLAIKADTNRFKKVLTAFGATKATSDVLLANVYAGLLKGNPIPSFYTKDVQFTKPIKSQAYVTGSGTVLYIPELNRKDMVAHHLGKMKDSLAGRKDANDHSIRMPSNAIYFPDDETSTLIYTNGAGFLESASLVGISEPDERFKLHLLQKPLSFFADASKGNLSSFVNLRYSPSSLNKLGQVGEKYGQVTCAEVIDKP